MKAVLFHTVLGVQRICDAFQRSLKEHALASSMSRAGNCLDNAATVRFFRRLKSEHVNYHQYQTRHEAKTNIIDYIEPFYNQKMMALNAQSILSNISLSPCLNQASPLELSR